MQKDAKGFTHTKGCMQDQGLLLLVDSAAAAAAADECHSPPTSVTAACSAVLGSFCDSAAAAALALASYDIVLNRIYKLVMSSGH